VSFTVAIEDVVQENFNGLLSKAAHWPRVRLGELATVTNGVPLPAEAFNPSKGAPVVRIRNILDGSTETFFDGPTESSWFIETGDLLIGMDGDFNAALWRGPRALLNQRVCMVKPRDGRITTKFLSYILPGYLQAINKHTPSITVKHLSSRTVSSLPIPVPPPLEQQALLSQIETQMSRLAASTHSLTRVIGNIRNARASVLKAAIEGRLVPNEASIARAEGRGYETASVLLGRVRPASSSRRSTAVGRNEPTEAVSPVVELRQLPDGWEWATVEQVSQAVQYGTSAKCSEEDLGVPVIRMGNISNGRIKFDDLKFLAINHHEFPAQLLKPGELLFNRTNSAELVGKSAVFEGYSRPCACASYLIRIQLNEAAMPAYVSSAINSPHGRVWIKAVMNQQVGQANVNGSKLKAHVIPLPPISEQRRIVAEIDRRLSVLDAVELTVTTDLARCARLRQSILKRAFEGRLLPSRPTATDKRIPQPLSRKTAP